VRARSADGEADELVLFDVPGRQPPQYAGKVSDQRLLENLRSFVAPIANDASAVVGDPRALQMARDLSEVVGERRLFLYGPAHRAQMLAKAQGGSVLALLKIGAELYLAA
jgi:hypothetical protein